MLVLYDNLLSKSTLAGYVLSASTSAVGFAVQNIADFLDFDFWKPSASGVSFVEVQFTAAQAADTLALYAHNIFTNGGSVVVRRWNAGAWTQVGATLTPTSNGLRVLRFGSVSDTRWRVEVTSTPASTIGVAFLGAALDLPGAPIGFAPILVPGGDSTVNRSVGGALLGVFGKSTSAELDISIQLQTPAWIRANWVPFMRHAARRAFIFCWDDNALSESWWCWATDPLPQPTYTHPTFMRAELKCRATDGL